MVSKIEPLAEQLLGTPSTKKGSKWRFGAKGSLEVVIAGAKQGVWVSREGGGGGPLDLVMHANHCSLSAAIAWARTWTGRAYDATTDYAALAERRRAEREVKAAGAAQQEAKEQAERIEYAKRLWSQSRPITGTPSEKYMPFRGLAAPAEGWPACIGHHVSSQSLIVAATMPDGTVHAVQRVFLTPNGRKAEPTPDRPTKLTNGVLLNGAAVRLPGDPTGPLLLAEGPETGLSVWLATKHETWIALGSIGNLAPPDDRLIVVCRDDDPKHSPAERSLLATIAAWRKAGDRVVAATPWRFRQYDKTDFNDALLRDGPAAVAQRIASAIDPGAGGPVRLPIKRVREELRRAVAGFFDDVRAYRDRASNLPPPPSEPGELAPLDAEDWDVYLNDPPSPDPEEGSNDAPVHAIKTDVGSGKTLTAYNEIIRLLTEMRAAGDAGTGVVAIPTHKLADEQAAIFELHARGTGLTARVWRGMGAPDPENPGQPMCLNPEGVQDARDAMLPVFATTCRRKLPGGKVVQCPFFTQCGYQRQREAKADLWIVPHDMIFMEKPKTLGRLAFLVVDESAWQKGLEGHHGRPTAIALDALSHAVPVLPGQSPINAQRLDFLRGQLVHVLRDLEPGPVPADEFGDTDLSAENTREAYRLEWSHLTDVQMHPGMSKEERRQCVLAASGNAVIPRLARVWSAMTELLREGGPQRSGWAAIAMHDTENGPQRVLHLKGRKRVRKGWKIPTLLIDATLSVDLVRPFWPTVQLTAELLADAPHQTVRQVIDRSFGKSAIEPLLPDAPGYTADEARRRMRGLRKVHAIVGREARRYGGAPVLLVAQKAAKEALPTFGPMAPCIDLAHHNAVAGRDEWRNIRALIVVGRTQPAPASVERLAEALTGSAVTPLDGWYQRGDAVRDTGAGKVTVEADRHPDPVCEAIRWQICEGELVQIIGRGRGVNRTEADPLDVLVLADAPLPIPVAQTLQANDLAPTPDDFMLAAGGIAFHNPTDAAVAYPQLWATREAAKSALARSQLGANPYIELYLGECTQLDPTGGRQSLEYQRAGARLSRASASYLPDVVPDPVAKLAKMLGPIAWTSLSGDMPPPNPSAEHPHEPHEPPPDDPADPGWSPDAEPVGADWWRPIAPRSRAVPDLALKPENRSPQARVEGAVSGLGGFALRVAGAPLPASGPLSVIACATGPPAG